MEPSELAERLASGRAWEEFCAELAAAGRTILAESPDHPVDQAEGIRYLTRLTRLAFRLAIEYPDPAAPELIRYMDETQKFGVDNPDQDYLWARISGRHSYRLSGPRGTVGYLGFGVYAGSAAGGRRRTVGHWNANDFRVGPDGRLEIALSAKERPGNWIRLSEDANTLQVRQLFLDRRREEPARLVLECTDREGPPPPLTRERVAHGLIRAAAQIRGTLPLFIDLAKRWREKPNVLHPRDDAMAESTFGNPDYYYCGGYWKIAADEALVFEWTPPECHYWALLVCNFWAESLDFRYRPVSVHKAQARTRPDGSVRLVLCDRDPGLPDAKWLDTEGHREGTLTLRYVLAREHPIPQPRVVRWADLARRPDWTVEA
jgi:hypothetical protein